MEFEKVLESRHSTRKFTDEPITNDEVYAITRVAKYAPVYFGHYPGYKLFIMEGDSLKANQDKIDTLYPHVDFTYHAPLVIVVGYDGIENEKVEQSVGCIMMNMQNAATNLGLASVYVYRIKEEYLFLEELRTMYNFGKFIPQACLCVGHPKNPEYVREGHFISIERKH